MSTDLHEQLSSRSRKQDEEYEFLFRIVLIGVMAVGKTHILERYRTGKLPEAQQPTIGVELVSKVVQLKDNKGAVRAQIWDTAGQERYKSLTR